jgi:hypothetical protein
LTGLKKESALFLLEEDADADGRTQIGNNRLESENRYVEEEEGTARSDLRRLEQSFPIFYGRLHLTPYRWKKNMMKILSLYYYIIY